MAEAVQGHHEALACAPHAEAVALQLCLVLLPGLARLPDRPTTAEGSLHNPELTLHTLIPAAAALAPAPRAQAARGCLGGAGGAANPTQTSADGEVRAVLACAAALQALLTARPQLLAEAAARGGGAGSGPVEGPGAASARLVAAARSLYERLSRVVAVHAAAAAARLTRVRARVQRSPVTVTCAALTASTPACHSLTSSSSYSKRFPCCVHAHQLWCRVFRVLKPNSFR